MTHATFRWADPADVEQGGRWQQQGTPVTLGQLVATRPTAASQLLSAHLAQLQHASDHADTLIGTDPLDGRERDTGAMRRSLHLLATLEAEYHAATLHADVMPTLPDRLVLTGAAARRLMLLGLLDD